MIREKYKDGDKAKAICYKCNKVADITFKLADYTVNGKTYPGILQGFCDGCGESIFLPHRGAVQLNKLRED